MEFQFHQHVERDDYVAFVTNHLKQSMFRPFNVVLYVFAFGYFMISPFILEDTPMTYFFLGLGFIAITVAMVFVARRNARKTYDNNPEQFEMDYLLTDEGLTYLLGEGQLEKKWYEIFSARETAEYLFIYVNKNSGMVVVKRDVPSDALRFLKQKLTENVKKLKLLQEDN